MMEGETKLEEQSILLSIWRRCTILPRSRVGSSSNSTFSPLLCYYIQVRFFNWLSEFSFLYIYFEMMGNFSLILIQLETNEGRQDVLFSICPFSPWLPNLLNQKQLLTLTHFSFSFFFVVFHHFHFSVSSQCVFCF